MMMAGSMMMAGGSATQVPSKDEVERALDVLERDNDNGGDSDASGGERWTCAPLKPKTNAGPLPS